MCMFNPCKTQQECKNLVYVISYWLYDEKDDAWKRTSIECESEFSAVEFIDSCMTTEGARFESCTVKIG